MTPTSARVLRVLLILIAAFVCFGACASPAPAVHSPLPDAQLSVTGTLPRSGPLSVNALAALGEEDVAWVFRDQPHTYRGVALDKVLQHCGFDAGRGGPGLSPGERRRGWRQLVAASGTDGFVGLFTCAELMPDMGATRAYVVWLRDGQPLPADEGPLRLVVLTDKKGSRSVRQLAELRVVTFEQVAGATNGGPR